MRKKGPAISSIPGSEGRVRKKIGKKKKKKKTGELMDTQFNGRGEG